MHLSTERSRPGLCCVRYLQHEYRRKGCSAAAVSAASPMQSSAQEDKEQNNKHTGSGEGRSTVKNVSYPSSNKIIEMVLGAAQSPAASTQKSDAAERREQEARRGAGGYPRQQEPQEPCFCLSWDSALLRQLLLSRAQVPGCWISCADSFSRHCALTGTRTEVLGLKPQICPPPC